VFYLHWQFYVQLVISASILTSAILNGNVKIAGWIILMAAQTVFITYVIITQQWGLIPQNVGMGAIAFRNYRRWKKQGIGYTPKEAEEAL
jgi:hypothetical protein